MYSTEAEFLENFYGYFIESTATFSTLVFLKKKIISYSSLKLPQLLSGYYSAVGSGRGKGGKAQLKLQWIVDRAREERLELI